jgi:hypothetical protein
MLAERGRVQRVLDELVAVRDGLPPGLTGLHLIRDLGRTD